jgi:transposase
MTGRSEIPQELFDEMTPAVRAFVEALLVRQAELEWQVAELKTQVAALEAKLGRNSGNSSKPPASEHPHAKPPPKKSKTKRKRGAQQGHPKFQRDLIPSDECESVIPCKPDACRGCGHTLKGSDPEPRREQVWDVEIRPVVTEYQLHRLTCPHCQTSTCGTLPDEVDGRTGATLAGLLVLLTSWFRTSRRKAALFASDVCKVPCSAGHVSELEAKATAALRPVYDELLAALPEQAALNIDETPFKRGAMKTWLWTFVAGAFTVFVLRPTRKAIVLTSVLGEEFTGAIHCDRAKMYWRYPRLQWCWAHLKRDFQALIDSPDQQLKRLGRDLMRETKVLFAEVARCRDGTITHTTLKRNLSPVRRTVEALLLRGHGTAAHGMCQELYDHRQHLWTFLSDPEVEPTNNAGERSLRHGVIWRKLSFGTQSARGDRFVETLLTIIETCRQQNRNVLQFVTQSLQTKAPSILIPPSTAHAA